MLPSLWFKKNKEASPIPTGKPMCCPAHVGMASYSYAELELLEFLQYDFIFILSIFGSKRKCIHFEQ